MNATHWLKRIAGFVLVVLVAANFASAQTGYSFQVLQDNPTFYWNFDEADGANAVDLVRGQANDALAPIASAGRENHATLASGLNLGRAATFNGVDQQFRATGLADGQMAGAWAVELWFQATGTGITPAGTSGFRGDYLFNTGDAATNNPAVIYDFDSGTGDNRLGLFGGGGRTDGAAGAPVINDSAWHHAVLTYFGNGVDFGVADRVDVAFDGVVGTVDRNNFQTVFRLDNGLIVGDALTNNANAFEGNIDEVAIYDLSGLGEAQIAAKVGQLAAHYQLAQSLPDTSLLTKITPVSYTYGAGVQPFAGSNRDDDSLTKLTDGVFASTNNGANLSDATTIGFQDPSGLNGDNGEPQPQVTFDLGQSVLLDQVWIDYIGSDGLAGVEAPDQVLIEFSSDGVNFGGPQVFDGFDDAGGDGLFHNRRLVADVAASAQHVRLTFSGDQEWVFLSEVQFVANPVPEPSSLAMAALALVGTAGLCWKRSRRTRG